jgi:hypothetical protein
MNEATMNEVHCSAFTESDRGMAYATNRYLLSQEEQNDELSIE